MKLSKNFRLSELTATGTGIGNIAPADVIKSLTMLVERVLQPARDALSRPITVNSGYRSPKVNAAVGGVGKSQHMTGEAVDITTGTKEGNRKLFAWIRENCEFDQLIDERDMSWIHVSYREGNNRNQRLKL